MLLIVDSLREARDWGSECVEFVPQLGSAARSVARAGVRKVSAAPLLGEDEVSLTWLQSRIATRPDLSKCYRTRRQGVPGALNGEIGNIGTMGNRYAVDN